MAGEGAAHVFQVVAQGRFAEALVVAAAVEGPGERDFAQGRRATASFARLVIEGREGRHLVSAHARLTEQVMQGRRGGRVSQSLERQGKGAVVRQGDARIQ